MFIILPFKTFPSTGVCARLHAHTEVEALCRALGPKLRSWENLLPLL